MEKSICKSYVIKAFNNQILDLTCHPGSWSMKDPPMKQESYFYGEEVYFTQKAQEGGFVEIPNLEFVDDGNEAMTEYTYFDVEDTLKKSHRHRRTTIIGEDYLIHSANGTGSGFVISETPKLDIIDFLASAENYCPKLNDLFCLFRENLNMFQFDAREKISEVYIPVTQPYEGSFNDFRHASYQEENQFKVIGNNQTNYDAWSELIMGPANYIFSCKSQSGWRTYMYTGHSIIVVGAERFRGVVYPADEVIYSVGDVSTFNFHAVSRPVVNLQWRKFPVKLENTLTRIICRTDFGDAALVSATYHSARGVKVREVTIGEFQEIYQNGKCYFKKVVLSSYKQGPTIDKGKIDLPVEFVVLGRDRKCVCGARIPASRSELGGILSRKCDKCTYGGRSNRPWNIVKDIPVLADVQMGCIPIPRRAILVTDLFEADVQLTSVRNDPMYGMNSRDTNMLLYEAIKGAGAYCMSYVGKLVVCYNYHYHVISQKIRVVAIQDRFHIGVHLVDRLNLTRGSGVAREVPTVTLSKVGMSYSSQQMKWDMVEVQGDKRVKVVTSFVVKICNLVPDRLVKPVGRFEHFYQVLGLLVLVRSTPEGVCFSPLV